MHKNSNQEHDQDFVPEDDAIIGRAVRFSLIAVAGLAIVVSGTIWLVNRDQSVAPTVEIETAAPVAVEDSSAQAPHVGFSDITAEAGIDFVHVSGAAGDKLLPETMGSGVAFFDFDNDGDQDLYFANGMTWDRSASEAVGSGRLYENQGGTFEDITSRAGLDDAFYGTGVAIGDIDLDGNTDLFVAAVGNNRMFRNLGGRFEDITESAGLAGDSTAWSSSSAFFDIDNDGDLDLFVCNYVQWSAEIDEQVNYRLTGIGKAYGPPVNYQGTFSYLYRNEGDGTFTDISEASGIQVRNAVTDVAEGKALAIGPIDIDDDGWMDLFVANDTVRNFLFHNRGNGTFEEVGELFGVAYGRNGEATGAMGVDSAHFRNDREIGFVIGNFANEMTSLYTSQNDPTLYSDEAISAGIGAPSRTMLSFGVLFFDYDLDGRLDILQANGHLENDINVVDASQTYAQPSQLFWNAGENHRQGFIAVPTEEIGDLATAAVGRGSAFADIDADGDLDIVITQVGRKPLLIRNDLDTEHHWLRVALEGNANHIGAWLELKSGDLVQRRQVMPSRSYQSQSEMIVTFGLGQRTVIDSLTANWPDGSVLEVENPAIDQLLVLDHPR